MACSNRALLFFAIPQLKPGGGVICRPIQKVMVVALKAVDTIFIFEYYGIFRLIIVQDPNQIEPYLTTLEASHIHLAKKDVILT